MSRIRINPRGRQGFTFLEIVIVVTLIALLAVLALPNFVRSRKTSQTNACINNLRQINGAKQQWALENGKKSTDSPAANDLQVYLGRGDSGSITNICCPLQSPATALGGYTINIVGTPPTCNNYDGTNHVSILN